MNFQGFQETLETPAFQNFVLAQSRPFYLEAQQRYFSQKNPRVRKIFVPNSGAGNGCANFMDTWKNASVLQEKPCP